MSREKYLAELYMNMSESNIPEEFASPISRALAMGRKNNEPDKIQAFLDNDLVEAIKIYQEHDQIIELHKLVNWAIRSGIDMPVKAEGSYSCEVFIKLIQLAKDVTHKRSMQCVLKEILGLIGHGLFRVDKAFSALDSSESVLLMRLLSKAFILESPLKKSFIALIVGAPLCLIMRADYHNINDMIGIRIVDNREDGLDILSQQQGWSIKRKGSVGLYAATRVRAAIDNGV